MKNVNTIHEQATTNREQWFQYRRTLTANLSTLEALYSAQYDECRPNSREEWLDTQARALYQAANRVSRLYRSIYGEEN